MIYRRPSAGYSAPLRRASLLGLCCACPTLRGRAHRHAALGRPERVGGFTLYYWPSGTYVGGEALWSHRYSKAGVGIPGRPAGYWVYCSLTRHYVGRVAGQGPHAERPSRISGLVPSCAPGCSRFHRPRPAADRGGNESG